MVYIKWRIGKEVPRHLNEEGQSGLWRAISLQQLRLSGGQLCAFFFHFPSVSFLDLRLYIFQCNIFEGAKGIRAG